MLDGSLGPGGPVSSGRDGLGTATYLIEQSAGSTSGSNLFHGFSRFDVGPGERATFTGADGIRNVIGRVSGNEPSEIGGTIRSELPGANLYLLNPAGIVFGEGARLDLSGSFHASTAQTLRFEDGQWETHRLPGGSFLSAAPPVAFGFLGPVEARIEVNGSRLSNRSGIELAAGTVVVDGASLLASTTSDQPGGAIELRASGAVRLRDSFAEASTLGGGDAGNVRVEAPVVVVDGSLLSSRSGVPPPLEGTPPGAAARVPMGDGGAVEIVASRSILVTGPADSPLPPTLQTSSSTAGDAGAIRLEAPVVDLRGATISTRATDGRVLPSGRGEGTITITAGNRIHIDAGTIVTASVEHGRGGDVVVGSPRTLVIRGGSSLLAEATADGPGVGGRIELSTAALIRSLDSRISADAGVGGTTGTIRIDAPEVDLESGLVPLASDFLESVARTRPACAARRGAASGSLVAAPRRAVPASEEGIPLVLPELARDLASARATPGSPAVSAPGTGSGRAPVGRLLRMRGAAGREATAEEATLAADLIDEAAAEHAARGNHREALRLHRDAVEAARRSGDPAREVSLRSRAARVAIAVGELAQASEWLERADRLVTTLQGDSGAIPSLIHLAGTHRRAWHRDPARPDHLLRAFEALRRALALAEEAGPDDRALSYGLGNLALLYRDAGDRDAALRLAQLALRAAAAADAPDAEYRWHHLVSQVLAESGALPAAIEAGRRAVSLADDLRQDAQSRLGSEALTFRAHIEPVYLHLVELLLAAHGSAATPDSSPGMLAEARLRMEQLRAAELRNYFRDDCLAELQEERRPLAAVDRGAAVVYPILLGDRLELLVQLPSGLVRFPGPEGGTRVPLRERALQLREALERGLPATELAASLYDDLVRPYAEALRRERVTTLVFVTDDALRNIPMGALWDGNSYVVEHWSVVAAPGLDLLDARPMQRVKPDPLLAGVSRAPGEDPLPHVREELASIHEMFGGRLLLDDDFRAERIEREVRERRPSLVHIASHGRFTGDPATSYVLAAQGERLTMERLREILEPARFRERPVDLLVLSACETAAGNDRAALGLAGAAIGAGARSALGTLWRIRDDVAREVITRFYRELRDPRVTKAEALRRAQHAAIERGISASDWSPFLLISNWL